MDEQPEFFVQVVIACLNCTAEGIRGPGALARLPYTLEGVSYTFRTVPSAEPPLALGELWLYTRFARTNDVVGERELSLKVFELSHSNERNAINDGKRIILGRIPFPAHASVVSVPFQIRNLEVPRRGRYELQLSVKASRLDWQDSGRRWRRIWSHFISVE